MHTVVMTEECNFLSVRRRDSELAIRMSDTWQLQHGLPSINVVKSEIESFPQPKLVLFDTQELADWDSSIVWFLTKVSELCRERGVPVDRGKLPKGLRRLVELRIAGNCVFLDAASATMIARGDPKELLAHSQDSRVRRFLSGGEDERQRQ